MFYCLVAIAFAMGPQEPVGPSTRTLRERVVVELPKLELETQRPAALERLHALGEAAVPLVLERLRGEAPTRSDAISGLALGLGSLPQTLAGCEALTTLQDHADAGVRCAAREASLHLGPRRVAFGVLDLLDNRLKWYSDSGELLLANRTVTNADFEIGWDGRGVFTNGFRLELRPWSDDWIEPVPAVPWGRIWSFARHRGHECVGVTDHGLMRFDLTRGTQAPFALCRHSKRSVLCRIGADSVLLCDAQAEIGVLLAADGTEIRRIPLPPGVVTAKVCGGTDDLVVLATTTAVYTIRVLAQEPRIEAIATGMEGLRSAARTPGSRFVLAWHDHVEVRDTSQSVLHRIPAPGFQALAVPWTSPRNRARKADQS